MFGSSPRLNIIFSCFASMEICDPRNNITMCPLCDHACSYWKLVTACGTARASHLFDNPATVFFSIFMALWGMDAFIFISQMLAYCLAEASLVLVLVFWGNYFHAPLHFKILLVAVLRLTPQYMISCSVHDLRHFVTLNTASHSVINENKVCAYMLWHQWLIVDCWAKGSSNIFYH